MVFILDIAKLIKIIKKIKKILAIFLQCFIIDNALYRCVAQFGRALRSGRRGRKFESCRNDWLKAL